MDIRIDTLLGTRIQQLRKANDISQETLAKELGIPRPAVTLLEKGKRKATATELVGLAKFFNLSIDELLDDSKTPKITIKKERRAEKQTTDEIRISVPQRNIDKLKQVLLYILTKVGSKPNIGETVIYKLLYFIDFDFYEKYEEQLIGATYIKNRFGPTPIEFKKVVDDMASRGEIELVKSSYFQYPQRKYLPLKSFDLKQFKAHEIKLIDEVLDKLSDKTASELSEYSHKDVPWLTAEEGKPIDYEAVFYRTPEYSLRT
jgi:transcriptional regulator with XRE-family HTH domain